MIVSTQYKRGWFFHPFLLKKMNDLVFHKCIIYTRMSKLLAVDLDGTLFYPKKLTRCISKKNVKFLREWIDAGNKVVLISSRSFEFVKGLQKEIDRDIDFLSSTSAQIYADGKLIRDENMPANELHEVLEHIEQKYQPIAFLVNSKESGHVIKACRDLRNSLLWFYKIWWFFQFKYRENFTVSDKAFNELVDKGEACKVMIFYGLKKNKSKISKEINKDLRDKYKDIEFSWTAQVNELTPLNCNKSAGLKIYCDYMNIDKNDVYVVGDSGNDISMFNEFHEHSYCMKHSYPAVKKYASHVISRVYKLDKLVLKGENQNETN